MKSSLDESGSITVFVLVMCSALILLAGFVYDGGMMLAAKQKAVAAADGAARSGAQNINEDQYRKDGTMAFNALDARAAGEAYLREVGVSGTIEIDPKGAVVAHTQVTQSMAILGLVGKAPVEVTGEGRSRVIQGLMEPSK